MSLTPAKAWRRSARPCRAFAGGLSSAGQRRRLSLARLLTVRRPVWLLDEPTAALDAAGQNLFAGLMRDHLARGGMIVAATHGPLGIDARELRIGARRERYSLAPCSGYPSPRGGVAKSA